MTVEINDAYGSATTHLGHVVTPLRDALTEGLWQLNLFGTDHKTGWPSDDTRSGSLFDHSRNGRHLSLIGSPVISANKASLGAGAGFQCDYTGDELCADHGECTLFAVAKLPNFAGAMLNCYPGSLTKTLAMVRASNNGNYQGIVSQAGANLTLTTPSDANTGVLWDLVVVTVTSARETIYRYNSAIPSGVTAQRTNLTLPPGGANLMRIGRSIDSTYNAASDQALSGSYNRELSPVEVAQLATDWRTYLAALPTPIFL